MKEKKPDIGGENLADRRRRRFAQAAVAVGEFFQGRVHRQRLAMQRDAQRRDGLVEQPAPGGMACDLFLVQELFQLVRKLMRAKNPQILEPGPEMGKRRGRELGRQRCLVEAVELEGEEQEMAADRRHPLGDGLVEAAALGIARLRREQQLRIGHHPPEPLLDPLIGGDRLGQRLARELGKRAGIGCGEALRLALASCEIGADSGAVGGGIEVGEIPNRQTIGCRRAIGSSGPQGSGHLGSSYGLFLKDVSDPRAASKGARGVR
jgi:hypothetical protein